MKTAAAKFIASVGYSGYSPFAPGTAGTLASIPIYLLLFWAGWTVYIAALIALFFIGVWAANIGEEVWGKKDPGQVVIDETAGYLITMLFVPLSVFSVIAGFFLFRIADIIKPPPARQFDAMSGGWGIMLDDVAAGAYALAAMQLLTHFLWT